MADLGGQTGVKSKIKRPSTAEGRTPPPDFLPFFVCTLIPSLAPKIKDGKHPQNHFYPPTDEPANRDKKNYKEFKRTT